MIWRDDLVLFTNCIYFILYTVHPKICHIFISQKSVEKSGFVVKSGERWQIGYFMREKFSSVGSNFWKRVPLSSTQTPSVQHISSTFGPLLFSPKNPSVPKTPQFNTTPQFHTKKPSVQHQNPLSSTPKIPQFNTSPSVQHPKPLSSTLTLTLNPNTQP